MDATKLLQWQYLIYLLPGGISALLLLLSSLRLGHHGGHHGSSAHSGHGGSTGHGGQTRHSAHAGHPGTVSPATSHGVGSHAPSSHAAGPRVQARLGKVEVSRHGHNKENVTVSANLFLQITGADRAPLVMLLEAFGLVWGLCGYWANEFTIHVAHPSASQMLPSLGIALGSGIIGARVAAEILARVMPHDESQDVSHDGLFGMTGQIVFPVSASSGRVHIYDEHGTLHDEMCRLAPGHEPIIKGRTALVVDIDRQGHLLVEEVPGTVR